MSRTGSRSGGPSAPRRYPPVVLLLCCDCATPVDGVEVVVPVVVAVVALLVPTVPAVLVLDVGVEVLVAGADVLVLDAGVEVLDVLEPGGIAAMAPLELDMMSVVATDPFVPAELRNVEE